MFGYSRDTPLGQPMAELIVPPSARERHRRGPPARIVPARQLAVKNRGAVFATTLPYRRGGGYWSEVPNFGFPGTDTTIVELY